MKRSITSIVTALRLSRGVLPLAFVAIVLPLLILGLVGLFAIFDYGYLIPFIVLLAVCAGIASLPLWWRTGHPLPPDALAGEAFVSASPDWGEFDNRVWNKLNDEILRQLNDTARWQDLQLHAVDLMKSAAEEYHGSGKRRELAFTIPELLTMIEEISRRYRIILATHVPFIENVSLSLLAQGYDNRAKLERGWRSLTWLWHGYRMVRMVNPVTAVIAELRRQAIGKLMTHVQAEVQLKLKQALLQEVVAVAIDLYSGRFKVDGQTLNSSVASQQDQKRLAPPLDPLRVCLLGQAGAGKSSIVNALASATVAEVSTIAAADRMMVHQCHVEGMAPLHLVDLPGLDGQTATNQRLLKEVANADLVIWVLKANQPARALDVNFKALLDAYYEKKEQRSRRRPIVIGVLSQVDRLDPLSEWQPPYDVENPQNQKARSIRSALAYNRKLLALPILIPLAVGPDKPIFNLEALEALLDEKYQAGIQAQLQRRRVEATRRFSLTGQIGRVYHSGKSLFKMIKSKRT